MSHKPPHLETEDDIEVPLIAFIPKPKFSVQGPSKYGKGGSRVKKAKGRNGKK